MQKKFLVIYGPTGVGKTDLSLTLDQHFAIEIINMDVGQFYEPFSIGTAKPDWKKEAIPHHFFDVLREPGSLNVVSYAQRVGEKMEEIWLKNKIPILVGGSGFYLRSLLFPVLDTLPENAVLDDNEQETTQLWQKLQELDPARAAEIAMHDRYRITRALAICNASDKKASECKPIYNPIAQYAIIAVQRDRADLYARINKRVDIMLEQGWIEEVLQIMPTQWREFALQKKLIGYNELIEFISCGQPEDQKNAVIEKIKQRTRNYAKRQQTFLRMLLRETEQNDPGICKKIFQINLTTDDHQQYSKKLLRFLQNIYV